MNQSKKKIAILMTLVLVMTSFSIANINAAMKVKLNKTRVTLQVGKSVTLKLKNNKKKVKWLSSSRKVAVVTKKGKVTAKKAGKAVITAKVGKKKYKCRVTVKENKKSTPTVTEKQTTKKIEETTTKKQEETTSIKEQESCTYRLTDGVLSVGGNGTISRDVLKNYVELIKEIVIADGVKGIGEDAFEGCVNLVKITIPDSVVTIGRYAFKNCNKLESITLPDKLTKIEDGLFQSCQSIDGIEIPATVTTIGEGAFFDCISLTEINIYKNVTQIERWAFDYCDNLERINVSDKNEKYYSASGVLYEKTNSGDILKKYPAGKENTTFTVPDYVTEIGLHAFIDCPNLESIIIGGNVKKIGLRAFWGCNRLSEINIPKSVNEIEVNEAEKAKTSMFWGADIFHACDNLQEINVDKDNPSYKSIDGVLFSKDGTNLIRYPQNKEDIEYTVPDAVKSISDFAFNDCEKMSELIIGKNVESIGARAMYIDEGGYDTIARIGGDGGHYYRKIEHVTCPKGSVAEEYVKKYGIAYGNGEEE